PMAVFQWLGGGVANVKSQLGGPGFFVEAMARPAMIGENRTNVASEVELRLGDGGGCGRQQREGANPNANHERSHRRSVAGSNSRRGRTANRANLEQPCASSGGQ